MEQVFPDLTILLQVDSAKAYRNEKESAAAIRGSGLDRSKIFYTSKVPSKCMGYEKAKKAIEESIAAADLGYIDLYGPPSLETKLVSELTHWLSVC
jgi:diketogulonate reductase-like aldo/keto reductase